MSTIPPFSAEISVIEDEGTGMRIECSEKIVASLSSELAAAGFSCGLPVVLIQGTERIHNFVQFPAFGGSFEELSKAVATYLHDVGVEAIMEPHHMVGERSDIFHLTNVSVFDK
ncbi:hypothetical protein NJG17_10195 [Stenotrophomonas maltophilia]|uniref:hypothetical protein n=1 Tax=Stenotrophomonas maltophilia TaxID=40324 RepID=UPI00209B73A2|nr:hypothetical protein [Stenotrophomonas maltophilia]MCO7500269.1 hypothetical protein [Stenotrophomonas maltophilia]